MIKRRLRIAFFLPGAYGLFHPEQNVVFGGAELNLYNLSIAMAEDPDLEITFLLDDYGQPTVENVQRVTLLRLRYMNRQLYGKPWHSFFRLFSLVWVLITLRADVVITSSASEMLFFITGIMTGIRKKTTIFRLAHDNDVNMAHWRSISPRFGFLYTNGLKWATRIIAQSGFQKRELERLGFNDAIIVKNGFFIKSNMSAERRHLLWVGRATAFKRPELMVEIARGCPGSRFLMILPENKSRESRELKKQVLTLADGMKNLEILDFVPFHLVQQYYDQALMLINTSVNEGFPNTFLHAALAACPILTLGVNPDNILGVYEMGYVAASVQEAILCLNGADLDEWARRGTNALRYARQEHDIYDKAKQYKDIILARPAET